MLDFLIDINVWYSYATQLHIYTIVYRLLGTKWKVEKMSANKCLFSLAEFYLMFKS